MRCVSKIRSGTSWETHISMYESLITNRLDHGSRVYGSAKKSKLLALDQIQVTALRLALGAFWSPIEPLHAETHIMPLQLSINMQNITFFCKLARMPYHLNNNFSTKEYNFFCNHSILKPVSVRLRESLNAHNIETINTTLDMPSTHHWLLKVPNTNIELAIWKKYTTKSSAYRTMSFEQFSHYKVSKWYTPMDRSMKRE